MYTRVSTDTSNGVSMLIHPRIAISDQTLSLAVPGVVVTLTVSSDSRD
jgi:hypothetical protein